MLTLATDLIEKYFPFDSSKSFKDNFIKRFAFLAYIVGAIVLAISLYTQRDGGIINFYSLVVKLFICLINIPLLLKGLERLTYTFLYLALSIGFILTVLENNHFQSYIMNWFLFLPVFNFLFFKKRSAVWMATIFNFASIIFLQIKLKPYGDSTLWTNNLIEFLTIYICINLLCAVFRTVNNDLMERLDRNRFELIKSEKLSSIATLSGGIAHEINNPLSIIQGKAFQLKREITKTAPDKHKITKYIQKIEETATRISNITEGLKNLERDSGDQKIKISFQDILEDVLSIAQSNLKKNDINLSITGDTDIELNTNPTKVGEVLVNLLNNAIYEIKNIENPSIDIKINELENKKLEVHICDNGKGVPAEIRTKIFDPFFTTKPIGEGTGLGLSISQNLLKSLDGNLSYEETNNKHCFKMTLPTN